MAKRPAKRGARKAKANLARKRQKTSARRPRRAAAPRKTPRLDRARRVLDEMEQASMTPAITGGDVDIDIDHDRK